MTSLVLVTAFEPFGGAERNASLAGLELVEPSCVEPARLVTATLPCVFGAAIEHLEALLEEHSPALVLCLGQARGRAQITLERVAINVDDARIPDNVGAQPIDRPIAEDGPVAYWSSLPIKAIVEALRGADLPAAVSQTAGTFVCNHVFYGLMHALARRAGCRGGFAHVPCLPDQIFVPGDPCVPPEDIARGIEIVLRTALATRVDKRLEGGATH